MNQNNQGKNENRSDTIEAEKPEAPSTTQRPGQSAEQSGVQGQKQASAEKATENEKTGNAADHAPQPKDPQGTQQKKI